MLEVSELTTGPDHRSVWHQLLDVLPEGIKDIHYTPEYMSVYEQTYGYQACLFVYSNAGVQVIQPVVKRLHSDLPFGDPANYDLESVYGFGGPLSATQLSTSEITDYSNAFCQFYRENSGVTEFCMLHPLHTQQRGLDGNNFPNLSSRKDCVTIDLSLPLEDIWSGIEERQRKAVAVARRRGVKIFRLSLTDENLKAFQSVYLSTMTRVEAGQSWHFPDTYFKNCRDCLGDDRVSLFAAMVGDDIVAYFFLMHDYQTCYYHFAASVPGFSKYNANSLLLFDTLLWAKSQGYRQYFLGGGRGASPDDSLLKFKGGFSVKRDTLYAYQRVINEHKYLGLNESKKEQERRDGYQPTIKNYFPFYRR